MSKLTGAALVAHRQQRLADLSDTRARLAAELAETDESIAACVESILDALVEVTS